MSDAATSDAATLDALVAAAREAAKRAYAPYSRFTVGCAVLSADGRVARGANVENACYRLGVCAEQAALAAAQMAFGLGNIRAIAVAGGPASRQGADAIVTPCGGCRQAIAEAATVAGHDIAVICTGLEGDTRQDTTIAALLPAAFALDPDR